MKAEKGEALNTNSRNKLNKVIGYALEKAKIIYENQRTKTEDET